MRRWYSSWQIKYHKKYQIYIPLRIEMNTRRVKDMASGVPGRPVCDIRSVLSHGFVWPATHAASPLLLLADEAAAYIAETCSAKRVRIV